MKYVVLARDLEDGMIVGSYGCYKYKRNAKKMLNRINDNNDYEYCIEEVDPLGNFAYDACEDEDDMYTENLYE